MLVIRLQRVGKKNQASFRVVLQEKTWSPKGKAKELLGFYNPVTKEKAFQKERIQYWISKGAQPSPTVHNKFVDEGIVTGAKVKAWQPKKKEKPAAEAGKPEEQAPTAETQDAKPAEEASAEGAPDLKAQGEAKPEEVKDAEPKEEPREEVKEAVADAPEKTKEVNTEETAPASEEKKE